MVMRIIASPVVQLLCWLAAFTRRPLSAAALAFALLAPLGGQAALPRPDPRTLFVSVGGTATLRVPMMLQRVVPGDSQMIEVMPVSPGQLLVIAKFPGETQLSVWGRNGQVQSYRVVVSQPIAALQQALREAFPNEEDMQVRAAGGAVYLTGKVADIGTVEAASHIARNLYQSSLKKTSELINLLTVAQPQQVQVHLRFVEVTRSNARNLGFNLWSTSKTTGAGMFGPNDPAHYCLTCDTQRFAGPYVPNNADPLAANTSPVLPMLTSSVSGSFSLALATTKLGPLTAALSVLESRGVAKTLSEPTLVAMSGQTAHFLAGGEFPIPIPDALGRVTITFKKYGAQVEFTPVVLAQDTINLNVKAEVSQLDRGNGVNLSSVSVPALTSRQSSTSVRMRDGQSFAIAGLLSDSINNQVSKVPLFGEIPVLGALFRQMRANRTETELMVLVSVNLVKPSEAGDVPPLLHNEEMNDPSDVQLFLMGSIERRAGMSVTAPPVRPANNSTPRSGPAGAVGFSR